MREEGGKEKEKEKGMRKRATFSFIRPDSIQNEDLSYARPTHAPREEEEAILLLSPLSACVPISTPYNVGRSPGESLFSSSSSPAAVRGRCCTHRRILFLRSIVASCSTASVLVISERQKANQAWDLFW